MDEKGFTLLEILIAISIAGIILSSIFVFFDISLSNWQRADAEGNWEQEWRVFEKTFHRDLAGLYYSDIYSDNSFEGKYQKIEWLIIEEDGLKKVSYYFDLYQNYLIRKKSNLEGDKEEEILFFKRIDIERIEFAFYDREVSYWKDNWSYQENNPLPGAVKISVSAAEFQLPSLVEEIYVGKRIQD